MEKTIEKEKKYKITIDNKPFGWENRFISGLEIRNLGNIPSDFSVYLKINGPGEDELVANDEKIDLEKKGVEHFYGCKPNTNNG